MSDALIGCPAPGSTGDRAAELRRQARLVDDLFDRVTTIRRGLPSPGDVEGWRGPAAELLLNAVAEQEAVLGRQIYHLDSARSNLLGAAALADADAVARGGMP